MPSLPLAGSDARTVETTGPAQRESCQEALTGEDPMFETQYEALRRQGISRRSFLQFCSLTAASLGIGSAGAKDIAEAMETKPRTPVIWLHGLECTCCTESFIRSYHPVAKDLVLSMISLDYDDTIMAAAGHQAEAALEDTIEKYKGNYILAVEGNVPLNDDGVNCIPGGETFLRKIKHVAAGAKAVIGLLRRLGLRAGRQAQSHARRADHGDHHGQAHRARARLPADSRSDDGRGHLHPHVRPPAAA